MQIEISREIENLAKTAAATHGFQSVVAFIEQAVKEKAGEEIVEETVSPDAEEWVRKLNAIGNQHAPTGFPVDDSRDSIYPDRV